MIRPSLVNDLLIAVEAAGFQAAAQPILAEATECIYLTADIGRDAALGKSRIGGYPDFPRHMNWPKARHSTGESNDARFIAQFCLDDLPTADGIPLPRQGMLWLFADNWGSAEVRMFAIVDPNPGKLFHKNKGPLAHAPSQAAALTFRPGVSLPLYRHSFVQQLGTGSVNGVQTFECQLEQQLRGDAMGQLGGYSPEGELNQYRWQAYRDLGRQDCFWEDDEDIYPKGVEPSHADLAPTTSCERDERRRWVQTHSAELLQAAAQWRLLLRLREVGVIGLLGIGDAEALEVYMRDQDLQSANFENLWGEMPQLL